MTRPPVYLMAALLLVCGCNMRPKARRTEPVVVRTRVVQRGGGSAEATYLGSVEPASRTLLTAPFPGTLTQLSVKEGQAVRKGQVAAVVRSESVNSSYQVAKATLAQARDGYDRVSRAHAAGSVADVKLVEIQTSLDKAEAAERAARRALESCRVKIPYDGVVAEVLATQGTEVGLAAPLLQIVDVSAPEIHFTIPEKDWAALPAGLQMDVEIPALGQTLTATLLSKGLTASPVSHTYTCILRPEGSPAGLMPGMVCKVHGRSLGQAGLAIPATALMTDMEGRYVWCVSGGVVFKRHVTPTGYSGDDVLVGGGLQEGDEVIIEGARKVSTGMNVLTRP